MRQRSWASRCILLTCATMCTGCVVTDRYLVFMTRTKFGLDISQRPDQPVEVTMGYTRNEIASIPATGKDEKTGDGCDDATEECDTYAVLGTFHVSYDTPTLNPWTEAEPLHINSFFATGLAARHAAENRDFTTALMTRSKENAMNGNAGDDGTEDNAIEGGE